MPYAWQATLAQVTALMPQKVVDLGSSDPAPTFSDRTVPTATQAQSVIDQVATQVAGYVGTTIGADHYTLAAYVNALGAKVALELGAAQEPGLRGGPGATLDQRRYEQALADLRTVVRSTAGVSVPTALFTFPADTPRTALGEGW